MPQPFAKCTNFGNCPNADNKEMLPLPAAGSPVCPDCGQPLTSVYPPSITRQPLPLPVFLLAAGVLLIGFCAPFLTGRAGISRSASASRAANVVAEERWKFYSEAPSQGNFEKINPSLAGDSFPGFRVTVTRHTERPWNIGVTNPLKTEFKAEEKVTLRFRARAKRSTKMAVMVQRNTPGFPDCFRREVAVSTQWQEYTGSFPASPMAPYESMLAFHCGYDDGWIEVAGVELRK